MRSMRPYIQESSPLEAVLRSFLEENSGQLKYLFDEMLSLAENPTPEAMIAVVEIYIQMNRVISSTGLINKAYKDGYLTLDNLPQYRQSIDPTLRFLLQAEQNHKQCKKNNAAATASKEKKKIVESDIKGTSQWLKQQLAGTSAKKARALVALVESKTYAKSIATLSLSSDDSNTSFASALALMLSALRKAASEDKPNSKVDNTAHDHIARHYLAEFTAIENKEESPGMVSKLYAEEWIEKAQLLEWFRSYMKIQLATIFDPKPEVDIRRSFFHDYSEDEREKDSSPSEIAAAIIGLFLTAVQYNYLRDDLSNSEDTAYIMQKLALLRKNSMLVQEFSTADIKFLFKHRDTNYVLSAAENIRGLLPLLDKKEAEAIAERFKNNDDIASLINIFRKHSRSHRYREVYSDLDLWLEYLVYLSNRRIDFPTESNAERLDSASEIEKFMYFLESHGVTLAGHHEHPNDSDFLKSDSTPYAIQSTRMYNSDYYGVIPTATLRQVYAKTGLTSELFAGVVASAYMKKGVLYGTQKMRMLDMACEDFSPAELFAAIAANDLSLVKSILISNPALLDVKDEGGLSPLRAAVMIDDVAMIRLVISKIIARKKQSGSDEAIALPLKFARDNNKKAATQFFESKLKVTRPQRKSFKMPAELLDNLSAKSVGIFLCKLSSVSLLFWIAAVVANSAMFTTIFAFTTCIPLLVACLMHSLMNSLSFIGMRALWGGLSYTNSLDQVDNLAAKFKAKYPGHLSAITTDFLCKLGCASLLAWVVAIVSNSALFATIFAFSTFVPLLTVSLMHCVMSNLSYTSVVDSLAIKLGYGASSYKGKSSCSPEMAHAFNINVSPRVLNAQDLRRNGSSRAGCSVKGG